MNKLKLLRFLDFFLRINIFIFSYLLYLTQLIFIFLGFKNLAKNTFKNAAYFCSLSLGINYCIDKNLKNQFLKKGIHISNHDNPLDIFTAQHLFGKRTITTVDQHLKNFLPFFEITLKNYGHFCFDYKNLNQRKLAYLFLRKICTVDQNVLIYPSGSIYTSIEKRFSKSVSKLSKINNIKVFAWKFSFYEKSSIKYNRKIGEYIFRRFFSEKIDLRVVKFKIFDPKEYKDLDEFHKVLQNFYLIN